MKTNEQLINELKGLNYPNQKRLDEIKIILEDRKDILELIIELKNKIDNAEENFGNLYWISKEQALEIINRELKERIEGK